jgi:uncharacterized membrane protein YgaE (UPF0421/DUF939 family)
MSALLHSHAPVDEAMRPTRNRLRESIDRFAGSDPGLNRLRSAVQSVLTIGLILLAERIFIVHSHALQIQTHGATLSAADAAKIAGADHQFLVIGLLLGAIVGMMISFGVVDVSAKGQLISMLLVPFPMVAALTVGITLGGHRVIALSSLVFMIVVGTYLRRFGPRGFMAGALLFMGDFFGFFLHGAVTLSDLGWLTSELLVGLAVAIVVRFVLFYPRPAKALARTQRSYSARARKVYVLALEIFDEPDHGERQARRLHSQLVRLNEAALMIDAQLGDPMAVAEGSSGQQLHQRLFDVELALTNVARFAQAMGHLELPADQRAHVRQAMLALIERDGDAAKREAAALIELLQKSGVAETVDDRTAVVVPHRFAGSVIALAEAMTEWKSFGVVGDNGTFTPSVLLFGGWLPGSAMVSAKASLESGHRPWERITLAPYTRTAIQVGVAVAAAIALGDVLSGRRFYWAVIAAFITFMGANNAGEQAQKAVFRVLGTVVGIVIGSLLVHAVGHNANWSITVILLALFFGFYLMRINYAFMVVGITVTVSQLYVDLNEFSNSLLLLRLEETSIGAATAIAAVVFVFPLRTRRVMRIATRAYVESVATLVDHATGHLLGDPHEHVTELRADARNIDASYQALVATAQPIRRSIWGEVDERLASVMRLASASRHYGRNLTIDAETVGCLDAESRLEVARGRETLRSSMAVLTEAINGPRDGTYTRAAALFDRAERRLEERAGSVDNGQLAIRDLKLVDGVMAGMADILQLAVTDYDTVGAR